MSTIESTSQPSLSAGNDRDWWGLSLGVMGILWIILSGWWSYQSSRPLFQVEVTGAEEGYARLVLQDTSGKWGEDTPLWFPAYTLKGGEGIVTFHLPAGNYKGIRFALEQGTPVMETARLEHGGRDEVASPDSWQAISPEEMSIGWELSEQKDLPKDIRPRGVSTWEWESVQPFQLKSRGISDWGGKVALKSLGALAVFFLIGVLLRLILWYKERCGLPCKYGKAGYAYFRKSKKLQAVGIVLVGAWILWSGTNWLNQHFGEELFLKIEMSSSTESTAQVFYRNQEWFSENKSSLNHIMGSNLRQTLYFPLTQESVRSLRFDPLMHDGTVSIYSAEIVTSQHEVLHKIHLGALNLDFEGATNQIQSYQYDLENEVLQLEVVPGGNDPSMILLPKGKEVIESISLLDSVVFGVLWGVYILLAIRTLLLAFAPRIRETVRGGGLFFSVRMRNLLLSLGAVFVLLLPDSYLLESVGVEASYWDMEMTSTTRVKGYWRFHSLQGAFLVRDYPFNLEERKQESLKIGLPRNRVHLYELILKGGAEDGVVEIEKLNLHIPDQEKEIDLLHDKTDFHWVVSDEDQQPLGSWKIEVPANQEIRLQLESHTELLDYKSEGIKNSLIIFIVVGGFLYLWLGKDPGSETPSERKHARGAARYYIVFALLFGMGFIWITPPYQTPDETRWLDRAWDISEGHWFPRVQNEVAGGEVPTSMRTVYTKVSKDLAFHPERRTSIERWKEANAVPLQEDEVFWARMGDNTHSFLPYVPQSIGFSIGKLLKCSPLEMTYLARIMNLFLAAWIAFYAIRIFPQIPWMAFVLFLSPIMVFLYGSGNHDPITNSLALLFVAYVFFLRDRMKRLSLGNMILLIILISLVIMSKFIYVMLAGLLLIYPREMFRSPQERWFKIVICWGMMIFLVLFWLKMRSGYPPFDYDRPEVDQVMNLALFKQNPGQVGTWIQNTYSYEWEGWREQIVGVLGWLDTPLPKAVHFVWWLAFFSAFLADMGKGGWRPGGAVRIWILGLIALVSATIMLLFYLIYTQPGLERVEGIQGRYLLPLIPLVMVLFTGRCQYLSALSPWFKRFAIYAVSIALLMTLLILRFRYWDLS